MYVCNEVDTRGRKECSLVSDMEGEEEKVKVHCFCALLVQGRGAGGDQSISEVPLSEKE